MEATGKEIVSSETGLFPDGTTDDEKRILEVLRKAKARNDRHMTRERIAQEVGAYGHAATGAYRKIEKLCRARQVAERTDPSLNEIVYHLADAEDLTCSCGFVAVSRQGLAIHKGYKHRKPSGSEFFAPKPKATSVLEKKNDKGHRGKTAVKHQKVKELFEQGKTYEEIAEAVGIPRGTVASALYRMIKDGVVERRNRAPGDTTSKPKKVQIEIHDSEDEEEDDHPEVLEQAGPDVAEILKVFENGANEIRRMGWHVEIQVKLSYPVAMRGGGELMGVVLMVDRAKLDSYEKEFIAKFNSLLEAERNEPGTMMPLWKLTVIHGVLLPAAGYVEAMIRANIDSICEVNGHPVSSKFTIDEVYTAYTSGYNKGALVANVHRPEIVSNAAKVVPEEGS